MDLLQQSLVLGLLVAFVCFYQLWKAATKDKKYVSKGAPEPAGAWPVIGHLPLLGGQSSLFRTLSTMADQYGPAIILRLGLSRTLVVSSWELTKDCFTSNDLAFSNKPRMAAAEYLGFNYSMFGLAPYGEYWREVRKIATFELLSNRRLEALKHVRVSEVDMCIKELYSLWVANRRQPVKVEMIKWFGDLTFNVIVRMIAGKRYFSSVGGDDKEARRFSTAIAEFFSMFRVFEISDALPFLKWFDLQGNKSAMKRVAGAIESIAGGWVAEHRKKRDSGEYNGDQDFIDVMLSIMEDGSQTWTNADKVIMATSVQLILAGSDTTYVTLTWALSLLLNNPHTLEKAHEELDSHVGKDRQVDESDIKNLIYLQAIVKETLRLYPAAPIFGPRETTEDIQVGGFSVKAGTQLLVNLWKLHRDPRVWSDPNKFQPERFLNKHANVELRGQSFEYIPFGSGRRSCPGISFSLQVLHLTLARLIHSFDISTPSGETVDMTESSGLTIPKATPLEVILTPRLPSQLY